MNNLSIVTKIWLSVLFVIALLIAYLFGVFDADYKYYEKSERIENGMNINRVTQIMGAMPEKVYDMDENSRMDFYKSEDSTLKVGFEYYDEKKDYNIYILFNDSLKVKRVVYYDND
jgi:hypothetical protein